jgi:regulator of sirC expression with transglutaminase-like and TPR domain
MDFPLARQRFYQALQAPTIDLAAAALYIAQEEYPELQVQDYLNMMADMAQAVRSQLPTERYPLKIVQILNHYLYHEQGFRGNTDDYYDPRNSFLNDVLDRRTGIPITLSLVYLEIAKRLDFPLVGVGFPGHFLIRPDLPDVTVHVDPFHQGELLFEQDCQERLAQQYGPTVVLHPQFFQPVSPQQLLTRLLTNLKQIYLEQENWLKCLSVVERILMVIPGAPRELRDRGLLYYQLGRWIEARVDLEAYLECHPSPEDQSMILQLLSRIEPS